jgi:sterol 3beta-glucosyltransferase
VSFAIIISYSIRLIPNRVLLEPSKDLLEVVSAMSCFQRNASSSLVVVNATMRPAAGIMGFIAYPLQGAWKSMQSEIGRTQEDRQHLTRLADGKAAVQQSSPAQRTQIIERFNKALRDTPARRKHYLEAAERAMFEDMDLDPHEIQQATSQTGNSDVPSTSTSTTSGTLTPPTSDTGSADTSLDEDAAFLKELEMAKRLSLAEYQEKGRW